MPTYEYECPRCGIYDLEQRITAPALAACEKCGGPVRRLISRSTFALRGGGWYSDGYAGKGPGSGAKSAGSGTKETGSANTDSAPAASGAALQKAS